MTECRVEDCTNEAGVPGSARGLCRAHYRRWQRYGTEYEPSRKLYTYDGDLCAEGDCEKPAITNGLCVNHYAATWRMENPDAGKRVHRTYWTKIQEKRAIELGRPKPDHCEMCGKDGYGQGNKPRIGICFDHDHETGKARGWLCDRCNKVLGLVKDDPDLLRKMIAYLENGGHPPLYAWTTDPVGHEFLH